MEQGNTEVTQEQDNPFMGGVILIGIGLLFLVGQIIDFGSLFVLLPAIAFGVAGVWKREIGLLIPAGILGGIGLGVILNEAAMFPAIDEGAVFMFAFALGWVSITVVSMLLTDETAWWALIPAGVMVLIGGTVMGFDAFEQTLTLLGTYWPVILIVIGLAVIVNGVRNQQRQPLG